MTGLVSYGSGDEEDNLQDNASYIDASNSPTALKTTNGVKGEKQLHEGHFVGRHESSQIPPPTPQPDAPLVGPALAPADTGELLEEDISMAPQSPYSANRALLRDLTLPTLPNYDIPPSPPGSPLESTNAKLKHFLELKKQGVHFNEKLAKSSALKNPSLMQKLMNFSDIDEVGQYETTLSKEFWNPSAFPSHAYKEELAKSQQKILKKLEDEKAGGQREGLDFVPASSTGEAFSRAGTPGQSGRSTQKSAVERVMAGLDRGSSSPQVQGTKRKTRFES